MSATVLSLPKGPELETTDFLRRLAAMMKGGRNSEMLLQAADMLDSLTERATSAEQAHQEVQEQNERNLELRKIAEAASDRLLTDTEALRVQLADEAMQAEAERDRLLEEARQLSARAERVEAQLATASAELDAMRESLESATAVMVPLDTLRLARAQFDSLAEGFAKAGDVISLTMCEIGRCAIDQAFGDRARGSGAATDA